ncbi:MAG: DnaA N-terminal domain-containing protein, partial [Thermodesulfobacteriota bacterium]
STLKQEKVVKLTTIETHNVQSQVEILAPRKIGLPTTGDLTMYLAFQAIVQERSIFGNEQLINPLSFTNYELLNRAQLTMRGERYDDVREWLLRMKSTTVQFHAADAKRKGTDAVSVFNRVISSSEKLDNGEIADCNYVWLSDWGIDNLRSVVPIDLAAYSKLKNQTAKLLVPHLQVWLYASRNQNIFRKKYSQFCALLGTTEYSRRGKIIEKLAPAMSELGKYDYIKNWDVTGDSRKGFVISITHGTKFFRDQKLFFVVGGKKNARPEQAEWLAPEVQLLPESILDPEQNRLCDALIAREIDAKSARKIVVELTAEEIDLRTSFCDYIFAESPGRIRNERGYLYTILKDNEFIVPESYLRKREELNERLRRIQKDIEAREEEEKSRRRLFAAYQLYEEFCIENAPRLDNKIFEKAYATGKDIWSSLLDILKSRLNEQIYESWFRQLHFLGYELSTNTLVVMASEIRAEWIDTNYRDQIDRAKHDLEQSDLTIEWYSRSSDEMHDPGDPLNEPLSEYEHFQISRYQRSGLGFNEFFELYKNELELEN